MLLLFVVVIVLLLVLVVLLGCAYARQSRTVSTYMCGHLHLKDYPTTLLNTSPLVLFNSVEPVLANMEQMINVTANLVVTLRLIWP